MVYDVWVPCRHNLADLVGRRLRWNDDDHDFHLDLSPYHESTHHSAMIGARPSHDMGSGEPMVAAWIVVVVHRDDHVHDDLAVDDAELALAAVGADAKVRMS